MALISDAQPGYALPEIKAVGLDGYFDPIIISAITDSGNLTGGSPEGPRQHEAHAGRGDLRG